MCRKIVLNNYLGIDIRTKDAQTGILKTAGLTGLQ